MLRKISTLRYCSPLPPLFLQPQKGCLIWTQRLKIYIAFLKARFGGKCIDLTSLCSQIRGCLRSFKGQTTSFDGRVAFNAYSPPPHLNEMSDFNDSGILRPQKAKFHFYTQYFRLELLRWGSSLRWLLVPTCCCCCSLYLLVEEGGHLRGVVP